MTDASLGLRLFNTLDALATEREATTGDMLDVAAVIIANYMLRCYDEVKAAGNDPDLHAMVDAHCWTSLQQRARKMAAFLQDGTIQ